MIELLLYHIERGLHYKDGVIYGIAGHPLAVSLHRDGHYTVRISSVRFYLHKLIYYFHTNDLRALSAGWEVHHKDLNKLNNSFENLELLTSAAHRKLHASFSV